MGKAGKLLPQWWLFVTLLIGLVVLSHPGAAAWTHESGVTLAQTHCASLAQDRQQAASACHPPGAQCTMGYCCTAPLSVVALMTSTIPQLGEALAQSYLPYGVSWTGIVLPAETKPPRSLSA